MFERFTQSARAVVEDARYEAAHRGDRRIGSEHLLIAVLHDETLARVVGADAAAARDAADLLDRTALAAIGFDLGGAKPTGGPIPSSRLALTSGSKAVIQQTLANAATEKARRMTTRHILLALLDRRDPDPAAALFAALDVDQCDVRERLRATA